MQPRILRDDLVYPELSYILVGCAYDVFNKLGFGHREKIYQKAYSESLREKKTNFKEQVYYPIVFNEKVIGKNYLDFLVDDKVVVELKKDHIFSKQHIEQVNQYLKATNCALAILFNFTSAGVLYKRIVNINNKENNI